MQAFELSNFYAERKFIQLEPAGYNSDDLETVDPKQFKLYVVDNNCELGSFMARCGLHYNRIGSVYYEFSRNEEIITEDKDIILMKDKVMPSVSLIHPNITSYCSYHCDYVDKRKIQK